MFLRMERLFEATGFFNEPLSSLRKLLGFGSTVVQNDKKS